MSPDMLDAMQDFWADAPDLAKANLQGCSTEDLERLQSLCDVIASTCTDVIEERPVPGKWKDRYAEIQVKPDFEEDEPHRPWWQFW